MAIGKTNGINVNVTDAQAALRQFDRDGNGLDAKEAKAAQDATKVSNPELSKFFETIMKADGVGGSPKDGKITAEDIQRLGELSGDKAKVEADDFVKHIADTQIKHTFSAFG